MKRILITGKNSYIGTSFAKWVSQWPEEYLVDSVSTRERAWEKITFNKYHCLLHVAGIAHQDTKANQEDLYYKVNRDLPIEIAQKAKKEGVKQFIFLSSMIVYGTSSEVGQEKIITKDTIPNPTNFYGKSKLEAEKGILALQDENFHVAILRPPMIYGKNSKGNYPRLSRLTKKVMIFPNVENKRSMLHIDNLSEFLRALIDENEIGIFFPQNKEYVRTSELVRSIAEVNGKRIWLTKMFNPLIKKLVRLDAVNKVFGNLVYDKRMSVYDKNDYCIRNFQESILLTEGEK